MLAINIIARTLEEGFGSGGKTAVAAQIICDLLEQGYTVVRSEPTYEACKAGGFPWESPPFPPRYRALIAKLTD